MKYCLLMAGSTPLAAQRPRTCCTCIKLLHQQKPQMHESGLSAVRAFPVGKSNDRSSVCVQVSALTTVLEATFISKVRQRWNQTPMAWIYRLIAELPRRRQPQSVAGYFNSPSLFSLDPKQFAKVIRNSFSGRVFDPKIPNDPIRLEFVLRRSPIFERDPRC